MDTDRRGGISHSPNSVLSAMPRTISRAAPPRTRSPPSASAACTLRQHRRRRRQSRNVSERASGPFPRRLTPPRCGTDLTVAAHSVGAGFPPDRERSRAQPRRAPGSPPCASAACTLRQRRRPQGHNGREEDDRSCDPRFRSAPTERQASVGCKKFPTHRRPLVPRRPACRRDVADLARPRSPTSPPPRTPPVAR